MTDYLTEVAAEKKFRGNVVIRINGQYYGIREPDSGLTIGSPFNKMVSSLILNPTTVDPRRVSTTIANYSFRLLDKSNEVTELITGYGADFLNQEVEIWLGRSGVGMPFADYFQLPITRITKIDHSDNYYNFSSSEETDRMQKPLYFLKSALAVDILAATTVFQMRDAIDDFPSSGFLKLDDEFVSYSGKNNGLKQFTGVIRGEMGSTPADHNANTDCLQTETVSDNPLNIILKILTSNGGGGAYDVLQDGLGIDASLVDVAAIEEIRDSLFIDTEFELSLYDIEDSLQFMEQQILAPCNLRFNYSNDTSKLSLVVLDKAVFVDSDKIIDEDSISAYPKWSVDQKKVVNSLDIQWDFDEGTNQFQQRTISKDSASISAYGESDPLQFQFKGVKADLDGATFIDDFASHLLTRLSTPTPEITVQTHIDKSLQTIGDKTLLESGQVPSIDGTLNFATELEIVSRSINFQTGDVQFKLAYTSFTGIRSCYLAPSDLIQTVTSQKIVSVPSGRGDAYEVGWKMRLWDVAAEDYADSQVNEIASISSDTITFVDDWVETLTGPDDYRLKFADYDDVTDSQKRYCFVSDDGNNFTDGKPTYKVTY